MNVVADRAGFSVTALAPFRRGGGALRLGLGALPDAAWRDLGPGLAARAVAKAAVFDACPDSLIVSPEADMAIAELATLLGVPGGSLRDAALAAFEDIALLLPDGDVHRLAAGAVAFPTDWDLATKMGLPLAAIHAPIPTYAERLAAGVDQVFRGLEAGRMLTRANWNVVEDDGLRYLPVPAAMDRFDHVTAANAGDTLFVRVERQVLRRLPESGAALFTIGVYIEPLRALSPGLAGDLAAAVAGVPAAEAVRRGTPAYRDALAAYALGLAGRNRVYLPA